MKNTYKALKLSSVVLLTILSFISCDKDFNTIESDVLGKDNSNFITDNENISITAYNKKLNALRINNLSSSLLGVFNDPAYGQTTASIVTQVTPTSFNPNFGDNVEIDSVVLKIPYFSRNVTDTTYVINNQDSLYGTKPIKLSFYQNNYFLRNFNPDPNVDGPQNYYSMSDIADTGTDNMVITENAVINFDNQKGALIHEISSFFPSNKAIPLNLAGANSEEEAIERLKPALRVKLDTTFWKTTIMDKESDPVLSNANNFNEYFRGIYIKAEAIDGKGNMILLDLASVDANITIHYSNDSSIVGERSQNTYTLNLTGNIVNPFINNYNLETLVDGNENLGDEKLYLKGAGGSMAVIDLFNDEDLNNNNISDQLEAFRDEYRDANGKPIKLINEAQLIIYEDENMLVNSPVDDKDYHYSDRIYAFDINNNIPLLDYLFDPSENTTDPFNSKVVHLGQRMTEDNGLSKYKIRITEHLNNIIFNDSTNTKIGLVLSNNINNTINTQILNSGDAVNAVPETSILTPRGSILYGTNVTAPEDINKKMRLEIFFTEPNN